MAKSFKIKQTLANALDDTVSSAKNNAGELHVEIIPLRKISLDPDNPRDLILNFNDLQQGIKADTAELTVRKTREKDSLASIAKSIAAKGVIQPITVYKNADQYILVTGERRTLGSILANKVDIPARILTAKPNELDLSLLQWIENIEREDLSLWERLRNLDKIVGAYAKTNNKDVNTVTASEITKLLGCSPQQASNYHAILNTSDDIREYIKTGDLKNIEKIAVIFKAPASMRDALIKAAIDGQTLAQLKKLVKEAEASLKNRTIPKESKAGRPTNKINFGATTNRKIAGLFLRAILEHEDLKKYQETIGKIDWDDAKAIGNSFRILTKLVEQDISN